MRCNRQIISLVAAAACLISLDAARAEGEAKDVSGEVQIPVSIGQILKGMRLPQYDKNKPDKLTMRFNAEQAERTSETQFSFKGLRIELFEESAEKPAMEIVLNNAVFDQETSLLKSLDRAKIKGEQFEIIGQQLEFDSKTRNSRLLGPVFMTIIQLEEQTKS
ncbi:MAG: LPS export ABC transporter periplasmic protein LptC [Chthoniobacterales bacterium]|nr:LPS export ABC transporter periplasmic protein LptC [Chthoniobacterales bacterium]